MRTRGAVEAPTEADYVIVGAGSAGCAAAARLAATGASVVLIEAGGSDSSVLIRQAGLMVLQHSVPQIQKTLDWGFYSVSQTHALGRRIPMTRGRILGGSSSVNGMIAVRGNRADFDGWAADGCSGWSYDEVLPYFKRMEDWEDGEDRFRGAGGPVKIERVTTITPASSAFVETASRVLDVPINPDYNGAEQRGAVIVQQNVHGGRRYSSAVSYLHPTAAPPVHISLHTVAHRVLIEGGRAVGVEVGPAPGTRAGRSTVGTRVIRARSEVILSAGAYQSPQLLMLSGIGPAEHLREHGIAVEADLPVGENLHDHLFTPMTFLTPDAIHSGSPAYFAKSFAALKVGRRSNWLNNSAFEAMVFTETSHGQGHPDMQLLCLPWFYPGPNQDVKDAGHNGDPRTAFTVMSTLIAPRSRGTIRLAGADPSAPPLIDPNFLAEPDDLDVLLQGCEMAREVMNSSPVGLTVEQEAHPGSKVRGEDLRAALRNRVTTVYHPVGSARMGSDERAVVDPQLRVRGIERLRVADASVIPTITSGNTNLPSILMGERVADFVLDEVAR